MYFKSRSGIRIETLELDEKAIAALKWAVTVFNEANVPFQVNGGLAAKVYGANRPLFDIDFDVPENCFNKILPAFKPYLIYGPERLKDATWDLELMTAQYNGVFIDVGGAHHTKCFDKKQGDWVPCTVDLTQAVRVQVYGLNLPVVPKQTLIDYKRKLARKEDLEDIAQITQC